MFVLFKLILLYIILSKIKIIIQVKTIKMRGLLEFKYSKKLYWVKTISVKFAELVTRYYIYFFY